MQNKCLASIVAVTLASASGAVLAQAEGDVIEEVIVTATKRASTIQDVPFSINAQTEQDIQRLGANDLEDLSRNVAGLTIQNLGPGQSQVAVRGVSAGQIVRDQPGVKEQVGVYLDESVISLSLFTPDFDLFDLNRVETLRGPQGTLFGSGSIGGTIRYITNQPILGATEGLIEADLHTIDDGEEGGHIKGAFNFPLGETAAVRLVGYHTEYAGYIDALREGGGTDDDVNSGNRSGGRIALRWEPNDWLALTPRIVYQEIETDGFNRQEEYNLYANPFTTTRPAVNFSERQQFLQLREEFKDETLLADLLVEAGFDGFDLTGVFSYQDRDLTVSRDASALTGSVSVDLGFPDAGVLLPSNLVDTTDLETKTAEVRLSSNSASEWQWLVGAFYSDVDRFYRQRLPTPGYDAFLDANQGAGTSDGARNGFPEQDSPFNSDLPYDIEQTALFAEVSYDLNDRATLTAGARYYDFDEERTITTGGFFSAGDFQVVDRTSSDGVTPRMLFSYDATDDVTFNAQVSQGFRLGGVNDPLNTGLCTPEDLAIFGGFQDYGDETLWNYEVGVKSRIRNTVTLNAAVFYMDIEDLQVTLDAGSCSSRVSFNVPESHTAGVEFELSAAPTDNILLSFVGTFLESEFDSTIVDGTGAIIGGVEDGNRLASVPETQLAASGTYDWPLDLMGGPAIGYVTLSLQYIGDRITQPSDQVAGAGDFMSGLPFGGATGMEVTSLDLELDDYTTLNLVGGVDTGGWEFAGYVTNLTDENADLSFDRERGGRARLGFRTNQPRTFGLVIRYRY